MAISDVVGDQLVHSFVLSRLIWIPSALIQKHRHRKPQNMKLQGPQIVNQMNHKYTQTWINIIYLYIYIIIVYIWFISV